MLESFTLMLSTDCVACRASLPINGIVPAVRCYQCGTDRELGAEFWTTTLGADEWAEALGCSPGEAQTSTTLGHPSTRAAYGRRTPRCQKCKGPDLDVAGLASFLDRGQCFCPGCGNTIRLRPADQLCLTVNPRARFVVHETAFDAEALALQAKTKPVLFACMGCGGGLQVDGSTRQVQCTYCGNSNYLPDGLWQQLRPVPTPTVFFLICEYDEQSRTEARWSDSDTRAEDAGRPGLTLEQYTQLARDEDSDVREALAKNPAAPPQVLDMLATDDYYGVRAEMAKNPATDPYTLHRLIADDDSDVREALLSNPRLSPASADAMSRSDDYSTRVLAAKHPSLPLEALHRLASDDDDDVKEAARARLSELRAQGVNVGSGPGFFDKLFK